MDYLSGLNASFLHIETAAAPMHAGCLMLLDVPNERRTGFLDELQRDVAARMQAIPLFTRKLSVVPFGLSNPVWTMDDNVDLDHHVRSHTLPAGAGMADLERLAATLHAIPLDRGRPLWELHLVDGLAEGKLALYAKVHHAALDGIGATAIMQALCDSAPSGRRPPSAAGTAAPGVGGPLSLLSSSFAHAMGQAFDMLRHAPESLRALATMRRRLPSAAPRTPFNVTITAERAVATMQIPLDDLSLAARAYAGTANDALLAIVDGALHRYLEGSGTDPQRVLVAAVPVHLRERGDGQLTSQVSLWRTELAPGLADAGARMRAIVHNTHAMRSEMATLRPLVLSDFPGLGMPWMMGGAALAAERARLAEAMPPLANIIVSYVQGPAHPPRIAGATVLASYPVSIVAHGLALNVTGQSCCGMLDIGLVAATSAVPDLPRLVADMRAAHAELLAAAHALHPGEPGTGRAGAAEGSDAVRSAPLDERTPSATAAVRDPPPRRAAGAAETANRGARGKRG